MCQKHSGDIKIHFLLQRENFHFNLSDWDGALGSKEKKKKSNVNSNVNNNNNANINNKGCENDQRKVSNKNYVCGGPLLRLSPTNVVYTLNSLSLSLSYTTPKHLTHIHIGR